MRGTLSTLLWKGRQRIRVLFFFSTKEARGKREGRGRVKECGGREQEERKKTRARLVTKTDRDLVFFFFLHKHTLFPFRIFVLS